MGITRRDRDPFYPSASRTLAELFPLGRYSKENLFRSVPQVPQALEPSSRHPTCILHSIPTSISAIFQGFFCSPPFPTITHPLVTPIQTTHMPPLMIFSV